MEELKPLKLEQPYSVIHQNDINDDPNKLGSWERPPHNSSKITRQNLDDALAVSKAFKDVYDEGNSLSAPEGDSSDYFLKAKDNIVAKRNDSRIGSFLDNFHGMDYFRKAVPEMEKGLKGTGYDMGPSTKIVDNLKEATDKGDTEEVENIIEEHPDESQEALPEDTPIQEEAEQITEDTNKSNDEVNNEVVEDFVKEFKDIDWDKVKVYEPGEDPYPKVSDESDWANNPDYEPSEGADVYLHHDEDFAGPDELPATIDQIRDEDYEQLAGYNGGLPAENQYEPVYDTSDYNFDWDAVIETLPPDLQEDMESLPEEDKEEISKLLHINMGKIKSNGISAPSSSGGNASPDIDMGTTRKDRGSRGSIGGSMLGRALGGIGGGSVSSVSVSGGKQPSSSMDTIRSVASKGPIPPKVNESNGSIAKGGSNNSRPHSNGTFGSGPGMLFDKGAGDIKTVPTAPVVPVSPRDDNRDENRISSPEDVKEAMIEGLESKIAQLSEEEMEALGIGHKYKHFDWKGIPLDELSGAQINELSDIVDKALRN